MRAWVAHWTRQELVEREALGDGQAGGQHPQMIVDVGHAWNRDHVAAVDGDRLVPLDQVLGGRRGRGQRGGVGGGRDDGRDQAVAHVYVAAKGLQVAAHKGGDIGDGVHGRGQHPDVHPFGGLGPLGLVDVADPSGVEPPDDAMLVAAGHGTVTSRSVGRTRHGPTFFETPGREAQRPIGGLAGEHLDSDPLALGSPCAP